MSSTTDSQNIQPMHQSSQLPRNPLHRQLFGKAGGMGSSSNGQAQTFASPTDSIMSPCTAKLQAHKNKHLTRTKPQMLFRQASQTEQSDEKSAL